MPMVNNFKLTNDLKIFFKVILNRSYINNITLFVVLHEKLDNVLGNINNYIKINI